MKLLACYNSLHRSQVKDWIILSVMVVGLDILYKFDSHRMFMTAWEMSVAFSSSAVLYMVLLFPIMLVAFVVLPILSSCLPMDERGAARFTQLANKAVIVALLIYLEPHQLATLASALLGASFSEVSIQVGLGVCITLGVILLARHAKGRAYLWDLNLRFATLFKPAAVLMTLAICITFWMITIYPPYDYSSTKINPITPSQGKRPNIILIVLDALTARDMSLYGYHLPTTPHIDAFAKEATVFDHAFSTANFTTPGSLSIITGKTPLSHTVYQLYSHVRQEQDKEHIAAVLRENGYQIGAVVDNENAHPLQLRIGASYDYLPPPPAMGWMAELRAVFLRFNHLHSWAYLAEDWPFLRKVLSLWPEPVWWQTITQYRPDRVFRHAQAFLEANKERPVFLQTHVFPPHDPYLPPLPFKYAFLKSEAYTKRDTRPASRHYPPEEQPEMNKLRLRYDENLRFVDHFVGQFFDYLKLNGYFDNSIIIVTADHGESFEHGHQGHGWEYLYQSLIHVPLLIHRPKQVDSPRIPNYVSQVDIVPTILSELGIPRPGWIDGTPLTPLLDGQTLPEAPRFAMDFYTQSRFEKPKRGTMAVMYAGFKYIRYIHKKKNLGELYDLTNDPDETADLASSRPELVQKMRNLIEEKLNRH